MTVLKSRWVFQPQVATDLAMRIWTHTYFGVFLWEGEGDWVWVIVIYNSENKLLRPITVFRKSLLFVKVEIHFFYFFPPKHQHPLSSSPADFNPFRPPPSSPSPPLFIYIFMNKEKRKETSSHPSLSRDLVECRLISCVRGVKGLCEI